MDKLAEAILAKRLEEVALQLRGYARHDILQAVAELLGEEVVYRDWTAQYRADDDLIYSFRFKATSWEDAEDRLKHIKENATLGGLVEEDESEDS